MTGLRHLLLLAALLITTQAQAAIDLNRVRVTHLDNGLTLLVLEEPALPVVSVQMAYKTGGRDDPEGRMGLAHFFEHMAFRASKNFPGTGLVSDIYAVGGEWHGYTWIDTITFFATAPKDDLDLLLRIEADRLGRLDLNPGDVTAEIGAVIAEMNGYSNDPATVLFDATLASAFAVHPYRKNTIGYAADVSAITHEDVAAFYGNRIGPNTAVMAVAGDVDADAVEARVKKLFGKFKNNAEPILPPDSEPDFAGEKRVRIEGAADNKLFRIAYPAPAASDEDYPAFLVLQALAGASSGVSFLQNEWGTPAADGSALAGVSDDIRTWFIATAQPYVFLVAGSADAGAGEAEIENKVQRALDALAAAPVSNARIAAAKKQVLRELVFDVETTEDAAHQLAYFEAIGALDQLLSLEETVAAVTPEDVQRAAKTYLKQNRRTAGWFVPAAKTTPNLPDGSTTLMRAEARQGGEPLAPASMPEPLLTNSLAIQSSPLSPAIAMKTVLTGRYDCSLCAADDPAPGMTSVAVTGLRGEVEQLVEKSKTAITAAEPLGAAAPSTDPAARLEQIFTARFEAPPAPKKLAPLFIAAAGDLDKDAAAQQLNAAFGNLETTAPIGTLTASTGDVIISIPEDKAQAALGYMAAAPARNDPQSLAWRMALYLFAHDYGGRLGDEAISRRGLAYYIGADYRSGPEGDGLITLAIGVDPAKQDQLQALVRAELSRFVAEPPDAAELAEAKRHLIGRRISAAQSNEELAARLAEIWASHGMMDPEQYAAAVNAVTLEQLREILPAFASGDMVIVKTGAP